MNVCLNTETPHYFTVNVVQYRNGFLREVVESVFLETWKTQLDDMVLDNLL